MIVLDKYETATALPYGALVEALREAFKKDYTVPLRGMHKIPLADGATAIYGVMPGWAAGEVIGAKLITVFPGNAQKGLPTVQAVVALFDGATGTPIGVVDGTEVTYRRTAAASALAADYLARQDAARLLIVGPGALGRHFVGAMAAVRPIREVRLWGRDAAKAQAAAAELAAAYPKLDITAATDLEAAVGSADIVSSVTASTEPVVFGRWLNPGVHLDLVGAHTPTSRECDDEAVVRARVYADVRSNVFAEAGEILIPLKSGKITESHVLGDFSDLVSGRVAGRRSADEITLFKSVGTAVEDLAAGALALAQARK